MKRVGQRDSMNATEVPNRRVRSGCSTCRRRKIKCDEVRPVCDRCTRSKKACSYQLCLIWEEDALSAGKCHGRTGVWSKHAHTTSLQEEEGNGQPLHRCVISSHAFMNINVAHIRLHYGSSAGAHYQADQKDLTVLLSRAQTPQFDRLYTPLIDFPFTTTSAQIESHLLEYYSHVICHDATHIRRDREKDPLPYMLLRSSHSRPLYLGIMMCASNLLSLQDQKFSMVAMEYRSLVLRALGDILMSGGDETEIIMLACMLCSSEVRTQNNTPVYISHQLQLKCLTYTLQIWSQQRASWVTHFAAYRHVLLRKYQQRAVQCQDDYLYRLGCRYFAYHLVIAKTAFTVEDGTVAALEPWTSTSNLASSMSDQALDEADPHWGVSNRLLLLINDIADLRRYQQISCRGAGHGWDEITLERIQAEVATIKAALTDLRQKVPEWISTTDQSLATYLQQTADAYQLASSLLLHESFIALPFHLNSTSSSGPAPAILNSEEKTIQIKSILNLVSKTLLRDKVTVSWPLWPLFIAGCCITSDEDKIKVLELFDTARRKSSLTVSALQFLTSIRHLTFM